MTSKREDIMAAIATLLAATTGVSGRVYRSRVDAVRREESPAIILEQLEDRVEFTSIGYFDWSMQFRVSVITRGDIPDRLADPVINDIYSRLMADRSLGGLVMDIEPVAISFRMSEGDLPACVSELNFTTKHRTSVTSLEL